MRLEVEIFEENGCKYIWIGTESGTGAEYEVDNGKMTIGEAIDFYYNAYCKGEVTG